MLFCCVSMNYIRSECGTGVIGYILKDCHILPVKVKELE